MRQLKLIIEEMDEGNLDGLVFLGGGGLGAQM